LSLSKRDGGGGPQKKCDLMILSERWDFTHWARTLTDIRKRGGKNRQVGEVIRVWPTAGARHPGADRRGQQII